MGGRLDPDRGIQPTWAVLVPGVLLVALAVLRRRRRRDLVPTPEPAPLVRTLRGPGRDPAGDLRARGAGRDDGPGLRARAGPGSPPARRWWAPPSASSAWWPRSRSTPGWRMRSTIPSGPASPGTSAASSPARGCSPTASPPSCSPTIEATPGVATGDDRPPGPARRRCRRADLRRPPAPGRRRVADRPGPDLGRAPAGTDEAAIGPASAADLGVGVGDEVTVGTTDQRVTIVGEALFPSDVHATFDEGLWLDGEGFDQAAPADLNEVDGVQRQVAIEVGRRRVRGGGGRHPPGLGR